MSFSPGFKSEAHRQAFQRVRICGAITRRGKVCTHRALSCGPRCEFHAGPDAIKRLRLRQKKAFARGDITPAAWAQIQARRRRNAMQWAWTRDPRLPGETISLGGAEAAFCEAVEALGADALAIYPAQADWLRWRWQRTQQDRSDLPAWKWAVMVELPNRIAAAEVAVALTDLGINDRRTREARAAKAAIRAGGVVQAQRAVAAMREAALLSSTPAGGAGAVRRPPPAVPAALQPWKPRTGAAGWKRGLPDRVKPKKAPDKPKRPVGRPRSIPTADEDINRLAELLWKVEPHIRVMYARIPEGQAQLAFLRDLDDIIRKPGDAKARVRWAVWVADIGNR